MVVFLIARAQLDKVKDVATKIAKINEVSTVYLISGKFDIVAKLETGGDEAVDLVVDEILKIPGITETRTLIAKKIKG